MLGMTWDAWITVGVLGLIFALLALTRISPDIVLCGGLTLLVTLRVISPEEALAGLANEGMVTVGVLFIVAVGLYETGAMNFLAQGILGRPRSTREAQARLVIPVTVMSAFLNNTPLVAMLLPVVDEWARRYHLSVSKLLLPLSYAALLGGACTLIGTSTNLVLNGLIAGVADLTPLGMFDLAQVGLPCALVGVLYILLCSPWLLPERRPAISPLDDPREYTVEMLVTPGSPLVGQTIEQAGLRHLSSMYLMEIERGGQLLVAVAPQERLQANDRLVFVGVVGAILELQRIRGLVPATNQVFKLNAPRSHRCLIEAVVSNTCPVRNKTIRDSRFRTHYNAAVIAVARNGVRLQQKIGDIVLRAGDTLLLEAHPSFVEQQHNSRDFFLVSALDNSTPPRHERIWISLGILGALVTVVTVGWLSMFNAALLAAGMMILTGCCSGTEARKSVDWQVLLTIAAAFGLERAMQHSGAASAIAQTLLHLSGVQPYAALATVYGITMLFSNFLTNNAAAVLMFPIALNTARTLGVSPMPFLVTVMLAASCSFATPIAYQTNLMVYGPGGYRFTDYLRMGGILSLLLWGVTIWLTPVVWPW